MLCCTCKLSVRGSELGPFFCLCVIGLNRGDFTQVVVSLWGMILRLGGLALLSGTGMEEEYLFRVCAATGLGAHDRLHSHLIVELCGDGAKYREDSAGIPELAISAECLRTSLSASSDPLRSNLEDDEIGKIDHIDFFKLRWSAVFWGHDIHGDITNIDNSRASLADSRCLTMMRSIPACCKIAIHLGQQKAYALCSRVARERAKH